MERRLFRIIIGLLALSLSCSKNNNSSSPSVTFLANGTPYSMVPAKLYAGSPGNLRLACGDKNSDSIILVIWVPKVRIGTYEADCKSYISSVHYDCLDTVRGCTVTISNIHDSLFDGTFSAPNEVQMIPAGTGMMSITQGTFKNIPWL